MNKTIANAEEAIKGIQDNMTLMLGGFGLCGIPENCIAALVKKGVKGLTCIANNAGVDDFGIGLMLHKHQVKKMISSYVGENAELPAGVGTEVAIGKEVRKFMVDGVEKEFLMEYAFDADFALVKAWKGDTQGNLIFRGTARNFNPMMAMAGKTTIAEVEELVPAGELDPDHIHVPGIYVHHIFQGVNYEKRIEQRTVRKRN
ncbi:MAG: CoA transferase subunit A [Bacteroidetes bacterium]|nr:CoA transferase subunit A [Bacteroidota bacterium]